MNYLSYFLNYLQENSLIDEDGIFTWDPGIDSFLYATEEIDCSTQCCFNGGFSLLASVETFLKYGETVGLTQGEGSSTKCERISDCCISILASVETYLKYAEAIGTTGSANTETTRCLLRLKEENSCCQLDVHTVYNELLKIRRESTSEGTITDLFEVILETGVVYLGEDSLRPLLEFLSDKSIDYSINFLNSFLGKGLVFDCKKNRYTDVETVLKYFEAVGLQ